MRKMKKSVLKDGSTIDSFTRIEFTRFSFDSKLASYCIFAEAITSKGEQVIVSAGTKGDLSRTCDES